MQTYTAAIGLSVLGSFGGLLTASMFLLLGESIRARVVHWAISYAVGTLLGVALLALLPEALAHLPPTNALGTLLAGVLTFFLLEKLVLWRHCHDDAFVAVVLEGGSRADRTERHGRAVRARRHPGRGRAPDGLDLPQDRITMVDSGNTSLGLGFQVLAGVEAAEAAGDADWTATA